MISLVVLFLWFLLLERVGGQRTLGNREDCFHRTAKPFERLWAFIHFRRSWLHVDQFTAAKRAETRTFVVALDRYETFWCGAVLSNVALRCWRFAAISNSTS